MDHPFRKAAVGGFNRQDVLDYVEKTAQEAAAREQSLRDQLAQAEQSRDEAAKDAETLRARVKELEEQAQTLTQERDRALGDQKELEDRIAELELNQEEQDRLLAESRQARTQAEQRADALAADASAYTAIKDRTAGVELRAHQRARAVEDQADREAQQLRAQLEQWLQKINREYDHLRSQVEAAVTHAGDQLNRAGECLDQVNALLGRQEDAFAELGKVCTEPLPERGEN